jgi:hypothetical protein
VTWIVEMPIVWIFPAGERLPGFPAGERVSGQIAIGVPELVPEGDGVAICPITMGGLDGSGRVTPIHGQGTLQALRLALGFIEHRIRDSVAQGVRVLLPGEEEEDPERATASLLVLFTPPPVERG